MVRMPDIIPGDPDIFWFKSISLRGGTRCSTLCPRPHGSGRSRHTSHRYVTRRTTQPQITEQRALVDSVILQPPTMAVQKSCSLGQVVTRVEAYMVLKIPDTPHTLQHTQHTPFPWTEGQEQTGPYIIGSSLDLLIQLVLILIPERRVAHQEDIQDDPYKTEHRSLGSVTCFAEEPRKATWGSEPPRKSRTIPEREVDGRRQCCATVLHTPRHHAVSGISSGTTHPLRHG